ncbi:MAG: prepilin-type N-terminal cleavage/methylation domain-containing protein [Nitrospiraceae bacterium]|nr:prepilin-type N-terminal cleavage/methylation domain-containing protein [Nitrospiraceae bacterium]
MNKKGFTLIEILITLVILGILAAIAIPMYTGYERSGARQEATTNLQGLSLCMEQYYAENAAYTPPAATYTPPTPGVYIWKSDSNGNVTENDFATWLPSFNPKKSAATVNNYEYQVTAPAAATAYTATAIPVRGSVVADGNLTIDNNGNKTPLNNW